MGAKAPRKRIALTFDDGPTDTTLDILAVLEEKQAPATFFVVGRRARKRRDIVERMAASAYVEIGNHSATHADLITLTADEVHDQLASTNALITRITGRGVTAFRPPRGHHDAVVRRVAAECGLSVVLFSLNPKDWARQDAAAAIHTVVTQARSGDVVVLHDTLPSTADAIGAIVDGLRSRGFTIVNHRDVVGDLAPGEWSDGALCAWTRGTRWARRVSARVIHRAGRIRRTLLSGRAPVASTAD